MKKFIQRKKGFSILEVIVATFIFVMIMVATAVFFGKSMFSYRSAKVLQKDLETAQFSMNLLSKSLRTSSVLDYTASSRVKIFDYSQNKCIEYKYESNALKVATFNTGYNIAPIIQEDNKNNCNLHIFQASDFSAMTSGIVSVFFNIIPSSDSSPKTVGRVTISMKVCPSSGCSGTPGDEAKIQSTVSLRDYMEAGL